MLNRLSHRHLHLLPLCHSDTQGNPSLSTDTQVGLLMDAMLAHVDAGDAEAIKIVASQIIMAAPTAGLDRLIDQPRMAICAIARRLHQHGVSPDMIQPDSAHGAAETDVQTMCRMLTI